MKKIKNKKYISLLIVGDLHGKIPKIHFKKNEYDAIICPGDICGDKIRKYYKIYFEKIKNKKIKPKFNDKICPEWKRKILDYQSLKEGEKVLKYLNSLNKKIFLVPGNWDFSPHLDGIFYKELKKDKFNKLLKKFKNIKNVEHKKINFKGIEIIGYGSTSAPEIIKKPKIENYKKEENSKEKYELEIKRYKFFKKINKKLNNLFEKSKNKNNPIIFLTHNTPYKTKLDIIKNKNSPINGKHFGSIIAKELIKKHQPLLNICGHIHEGFGTTKIKKTKIINSGHNENTNILIKIDLNKNKIIEINFKN